MLLAHERNYGLGMDALMTVCSWNTNGFFWLSMDALMTVCSWDTTRTLLGSGHGCSHVRMLLEHERNYGSGMDDLMTVCFWRTNGINVWAWML